MDHSKLSDYLLLLKHLIDFKDGLYEYHMKVESLLGMILEKDLIDFPSLKLQSYLLALSDSVEQTASFTEDLIGIVNNITSLLMNLDSSTVRL